MKRFLKSLSLLLCSGLFAMTGWAETIAVNQETIGINFTQSGKLMSADANSTEEWGYYSQENNQGGLLAENKWQNFTSLTQNASYAIRTAGNLSLSIQLKKTTNNAVWGPGSNNSFYTENKLLGAYLDNGSTLEFSGLPTSGYDVAIIFAGDGGAKLSCVAVNGTDKTYNENGELVDGSDPWGERKTGAADLKQLTATGTSDAERVMYLSDLNTETLTLQTYSNSNGRNGRGTIAAIQIYLKSGTVEKTLAELPTPAWTWDGKKADGSSCEALTTLPVGTAYQVNGRIFDLDALKIPAKNFTYSFWTMRDGPANWRNYAGFSNASGTIQIQRDNSGSTVHIYAGDGATLASGDMAFPLASNSYELVTLVQDSGTFKVYVNGILCDTDTLTGWASLTDEDATIRWFALGAAPNASGGAYVADGVVRNADARIADARIYDVALSAEQVKALYAATPVDATYWATFNGDALTSDKVNSEDGFSLQGDAASYITVSGSNKAWNVSGDSWGTQSVLAEDSTTFTLSVNAKTGTNPNGLLFAFGNKDNGGLALRRTDANHVVLTTGTSTDPVLTGEAIACDINYYNYTIVAVAGKLMLYINGVPVKDGEGNIVEVSATNLITTNNFQPGRRHGGLLGDGEKNGNGAIDEMVIWKNVALSSVQVKNTYDLFLKTAIARRTLATAEENWSDAEWNDGNDVAPTQGQVMLTSNVDGGSTLTMDTSVTVDALSIFGETPVTIAASDTNKLTSSNTRIETNTTVNAGAANLGAVVIADGKTLTVKDNATVDSVVGGTLAIDATAGDVVFTADTALTRGEIRQYTGKIHVKGAGENGITLEYGGAQASEFGPNLILDGGTHTFYYQRSGGDLFASGDSNTNPTIWVKNNAKLTFRSHDLSGWQGDVNATGVIRVDNGSTLNFTNNGGSTSYYRQRLYLEPGATMTIADAFNNNFRLHGGVATAETAQLYVPGVEANAEAKVATISGGKITFAKDDTNGLGFFVGANAMLKITSPFAYDTDDGKASPIAKYGDGTLLLTGGYAPTGTITIDAGTLALGFTGALTNTITNNATLAADGENVVMNLTGATLSGDGTYLARNGAILKLSLTQAQNNTVATNGGKVYIELTAAEQESEQTISVDVANGGTFQFVDANNNPLSAPNTNYVPSTDRTYNVTTGVWANATAPSDYENVIIDFGETPGQEVDLAAILGEVTALAHLTVTGANGTITNAASIASCPAIVVDAVTMPAELVALADTIEVTTSLSLVGTAEETTIDGVISGAGQVKITAGKVKFTNTNTYTGGTDIATNATLTMGNANAIGTTGNITGAGTLKFSQFVPANLNGLTTGTAASGETPATGWTGTFYMMNRPSSGTFPVNDWGNANSTVCFENCSGYLTPAGGTTVVPNIRVEGNGWRSQNGNGNAQFTFTGALSGSGKLEVATATPSDGNFYKFTGDVSKFTGYVNVTNNHRVVFGNADSQGNGKITIATNMTIATSMTWSAVNGLAIMDGTTLTVNGAITGAIANAGVLTYKVDTTASNTFTGAGFIVANGEGVELDLCSATLTDFSGFLNATGGATIKLPYAETEGKTLSFDEDSTFVVVYSDAETEQNNLHAVTVTGRGTLQFVDAAGNALPFSGSTYVPSVYTVTAEGGSWNVEPLQNNKITIDFAETTDQTVDLAAILGEVTALSKVTVTGSNGGTITNSTVTACPTVVITAGGRTNVPAALTSLATTVTGPTAEGSLLYVTGETTATTSRYPYTGNRHFETLKFTGAKTIGQDIDTYEVATGEKLEFHYNDGACYEQDLVVNGGTIATKQNTYVWLAGIANKTFTLKAGTADFSNVTVDNGTQGLLIGYQEETHTFDIQGGELNAPNTSIVAWETDCRFIQSGGTVKTKGFRQRSDNNNRFTVMTLTGGTIELGSGGIPNLSMENISFGGATIHAVADNTIAEALNMTANAILSAAEGKTMKVTSAITAAEAVTLSIAGVGTVDLSGATIANTIALEVAAESTATVLVSAEQLTTFAKVTVPEGATLKVKTNYTIDEQLTGGRKEYTLGEDSSIAGTVTIDGVTGTGAFSEGKLTVSFEANPMLTGNAWWWDYEFNGNGNNIGSDGTALSWDGTRPYQGAEYTDPVEGDTNQMLKLPARPWRNVGTWPTEATFVMYAKAGTKTDYYSVNGWDGAVDGKDNGILVSFGSSQSNGKSITLMTGANPENGDMRLVYAEGTDANSVVDLVENLSVPNATTSYHLYAFVLETVENKTHVSVYVDGGLVATYTADSIIQLGGGFQIASVHGGPAGGLNRLANEDTATMDFLRVYNGVLSAEAMQSLADAYPYTSPNGTASRTVASTDAVKTWIGAENERVWTQTTLADDGSGNTTDEEQVAPTAGSVVKVTVGDTTSVALNIPAEGVSYEALDISESLAGENTLTLTAGQDAGLMTIAGKTSIKANTTIAAGAVKIGAVDVAEGKTLTFDYSAYDFRNVWTSMTIPLTGLATGEGNIAVTFPAEKPAQIKSWACVKDPSTSTYAIVVTVDLSDLTGTVSGDACAWNDIVWTINNGETVVVPSNDFLLALPTVRLAVADNAATLNLVDALTLNAVTVSGGTLTFAGAELTVASLTLDNADVMATTTLRASAVTGTEGAECLTMTLPAGEYTRAMALSNCAFTKDGEGTLKLNPNGIVLNQVVTTLAEGKLELRIGNDDPQIENATFIYVDDNEDGVADGELTNHGWVRSSTVTTFVVPENVTGKAVAGSCLSSTGEVVKQSAGTLVLGVMTTDDDGPYTGATTIEAGTLVYQVADARACTMTGAITVAANAAIKGSTKCTLASLSFANGAVIDATNGPVTATAVTLPAEDGTVTVRMTNHGEVLKTTGLDNVEKFVAETPVANCNLMVTDAGLAYVKTPELPQNMEVTEDVNEIIQEAADVGITNVTIEGITLTTDGEGNPVKTASVEGLELFDNIPRTIVPENNGAGKVILDYVFGISDITVNAAGNIIVKASVDCIMDYSVAPIDGEGGETPAEPVKPTFVNGVAVELLNGEDVIGEAEVNVAGSSEIEITSDDTLVTIFANGTGTLDLTVRATNVQTPETPEGDEEEVTPAE